MKDLRELLQAIESSIVSVEFTLKMTDQVQPKGHRLAMVRGQLEAAREVLKNARGHCASGMTGTYSAADLGQTKKP